MSGADAAGVVVAVCRDDEHAFSKAVVPSVRLLAGLGVEGDTHAGVTVQHRSRVARDPSAPNLRQVHLIHAELHDRLIAAGFHVGPGVMGENVTTRGVDLLGLPTGAVLRLGPDAQVQVTGLRNPCVQLDRYQRGLTQAVLDRDGSGRRIRLAGVMGVVLAGGVVAAGDDITVEWPTGARAALAPV